LEIATSDSTYYIAFAIELKSEKRLHLSTLPMPPSHWGNLQYHPQREGFTKAAQQQWNSLVKKITFQEVEISSNGGKFALPLMWVFNYKLDDDGYLLKYKARLVVRGDLQRDSIYNEVYAATLAAHVFRALIAKVAYFDLEMHQLDVVAAFTNSVIDEELYTQFPAGYQKPGYLIRLRKAL
jgi:hypothetical protein